MISVKYSASKKAVEARIHRLPQMMIGQMKAHALHDAKSVIENFKYGISNRLFRLKSLKPTTIASKVARGFEKPDVPLYGLGEEERDSYINCLHVRNIGNRLYSVEPRNDWHHGKRTADDSPEHKIRLKDLFDVHEYGTVINNAFGRKGLMVRVPPRPALRYAYKAYMAYKKKTDPEFAVRIAIAKYVRSGDREALARIARKLEKGFGGQE